MSISSLLITVILLSITISPNFYIVYLSVSYNPYYIIFISGKAKITLDIS